MADFQRQNRGRDQRTEEEKVFEEIVINIDRVARVVKGGRRFRFKALVVVGDKKNRVGVGVSKGADVQTAVIKATAVAKKNIRNIAIHKATITHDSFAKVGGAKVLLKPAAPGTGVIAGGAVRDVLSVTGIHNVLSKSLGSSNKVNIAYATIQALVLTVPQSEWVTNQQTSTKRPAKVPAEPKIKTAKAVKDLTTASKKKEV